MERFLIAWFVLSWPAALFMGAMISAGRGR